jgi:hypothetical protein
MPSIETVTPFYCIIERFKNIVSTCYTRCTAINFPISEMTKNPLRVEVPGEFRKIILHLAEKILQHILIHVYSMVRYDAYRQWMKLLTSISDSYDKNKKLVIIALKCAIHVQNNRKFTAHGLRNN